MINWIKSLFGRKPREPRITIVSCDDPDPVRDEVLRRAFFSDGPVFATRNDDGTVTFGDDNGEETIPIADLEGRRDAT